MQRRHMLVLMQPRLLLAGLSANLPATGMLGTRLRCVVMINNANVVLLPYAGCSFCGAAQLVWGDHTTATTPVAMATISTSCERRQKLSNASVFLPTCKLGACTTSGVLGLIEVEVSSSMTAALLLAGNSQLKAYLQPPYPSMQCSAA